MTEEFVPDASAMPAFPASPSASVEPTSNREPVKILIMGSRYGVNTIIHTLYRLRFAEVTAWSPLQPTGNPGEFVSMLIRHISTR